MTPRNQIKGLLAGQPAGQLTLFWKHFGPAEALGQPAVDAHRTWIEQTKPAVVKVMNEQLYPHGARFTDPSQWGQVGPYPASHPAIQRELEVVRTLVDQYGSTHHVLVTVHGLVASAFHARGGGADYDDQRHELVDALRAEPALVAQAYERIGESLVEHVNAYLDAGADGIFLAALGGERGNFTADEYDRYVRPYDQAILAAAGNRGALRFLHICKDDVDLARFAAYEAEFVHTGEHLNDFGLADLRRQFPTAVVCGGIDNQDPFFVGPSDPGRAAELVAGALDAAAGDQRFLICADCSLPNHTPPAQVALISEAAATYVTNERP